MTRYAPPVMRFAVVGLIACSAPAAREPAIPAPSEGISIALYTNGLRNYGVVDDRRTIEVAGNTVILDRIDPAAALQSLVIEPLGNDPIRVVSCVRERIDESPEALASLAAARDERPRGVIVHDLADQRFHIESSGEMEPAIPAKPGVLSPIVRCRVQARPGKHLVRVLHVTSSLAFRTQHELQMTDAERVTISTRFAIETPLWRERASITLFEGVPGDEKTPYELARGPIVLDGSTAILGGTPREFAARLRSVYDGAKIDHEEAKPSDIVWGRESRRQVWVWLELTDASAKLPKGAMRAHIELPGQQPRDLDVAVEQRVDEADAARWQLWIDEDLIGTRVRTIDRADGVVITDRITLTVSNLGTQPREVWVEERLRTEARRRTLAEAWPSRPGFAKNRTRSKLTLAPGKTERLGFTIDYEF